MTIDERLENISRNLDTLTKLHLDSERQREQDDSERRANDREYRERFQQNEKRLAQLMDTMNRLGRILEIHDQRLDDLEGGQ